MCLLTQSQVLQCAHGGPGHQSSGNYTATFSGLVLVYSAPLLLLTLLLGRGPVFLNGCCGILPRPLSLSPLGLENPFPQRVGSVGSWPLTDESPSRNTLAEEHHKPKVTPVSRSNPQLMISGCRGQSPGSLLQLEQLYRDIPLPFLLNWLRFLLWSQPPKCLNPMPPVVQFYLNSHRY